MEKIIGFEELPTLLETLKNRELVLVGGCFDILHLGHIRFLKQAKKYGLVVVALESDERLKKHKGHLRPIHPQQERAEVLAEIVSVDYIILLPSFSNDTEYEHLTQTVHPNIIAITKNDPQEENKRKHAQKVGAQVVVISKVETPSTTQLAKLLGLE